MSIRDIAEQGVSKLRTRRQRRIRAAAILLAVILAVVGVLLGSALLGWIRRGELVWPQLRLRSPRAGSGPLADLSAGASQRRPWRFPAVLTMPQGWLPSVLAGLVLWLPAARLLVAPLLRRTHKDLRERGLAPLAKIHEIYGVRAVRAAGKFTLPTASWWDRWLLPAAAFGYQIGAPRHPKDSEALWVNWEQRVRIVARSGWGKTMRLLVPIIRGLPGPAVISSIEPEIFMSTVRARTWRRRPCRWRLLRVLPAYRRRRKYPVFVVDFTSPATRFAAGWPTVRWNPIPGCQDYIVATRRANALVHATDKESKVSGETDKFFRTSATQVLAAWLHAAALSGAVELEHINVWLRDGEITEPRALLEAAGDRADQTALTNMLKHLDPKGGRTTSGVERYLVFALSSLCSGDGRALCGSAREPQFAMDKLIQAQGTVYLLAEPERMATARPLLSLIAEEMFLAAERVARRQPGRVKRLPQPFVGVLDELRYGVRVAQLPYVANVLRKFGISYLYAVQSAGQEETLYGEQDAEELRSAAATSIYGGIDPASAREVADRAGQTAIVVATRGDGSFSEQTQMRDVFTIADQQKLGDGESVIVGRGVAPFVAYTPLTFEQRRLRRRIAAEVDQVNTTVINARKQMLSEADYQRAMGRTDYQPGARI